MDSSLKVVLDTNILISALIQPGRARNFIFGLIQQEAEIILSDYILSEVGEVLKRNKFQEKAIFTTLWGFLRNAASVVKVNFAVLKTPLRDPKDHPILKTAQKGRADLIVTGDNDLLVLKNWKGVKIVKMSEFENLLR